MKIKNKKVKKVLNIIILLIHTRLLRSLVLIGGLASFMIDTFSGLLTMTKLITYLISIVCWFGWDLFASSAEETGDYILKLYDVDEDDDEIIVAKQEIKKELEKEKEISTEGSIIRDYNEIVKEKTKYISLLELVKKYEMLEKKDSNGNINQFDDFENNNIGYSYIKK